MSTRTLYDHPLLTLTQVLHQTQFTRTGALDLTNKKPYRTRAQRLAVKDRHYKSEAGCFRHSGVPVTWHSMPLTIDEEPI